MKITNKIIVIDLEATCWEEDGEYQKKNSEIIEIGICILDSLEGQILDNRAILIKPVHSEVSSFCTKLTSITKEMLDKEGISLSEACAILKKDYNSKDLTWASYGNYDRDFLKSQCSKLGIEYPMTSSHINIKVNFSERKNLKKDVGMKKALALLDIKQEGTHHRGIDDAKNSAKILYWNLKGKKIQY